MTASRGVKPPGHFLLGDRRLLAQPDIAEANLERLGRGRSGLTASDDLHAPTACPTGGVSDMDALLFAL